MKIKKLLFCSAIFLGLSFCVTSQLFAAYVTAPYFPIQEGNIWNYNNNYWGAYSEWVLSGTVNVNGVDTVVLEDSDGIKSYYTNDGNGIRLHKQFEPQVWIDGYGFADFDIVYSPPVKLSGVTAEIGSSIQSTGTAITTVTGLGTFYLDYLITSSMDGFEDITVPAGSFRALKNTMSVSLSGYVQGQYVTDSYSDTRWLAKYIGGVKWAEGTEVEVLVSTNVAAPVYSDFNEDLTSDLIFQSSTDGRLLLWSMDNFARTVKFPQSLASSWDVVGKGDFNGDKTADVLYQKDDGTTAIAEMTNASRSDLVFPGGVNPVWKVQGVGDFNGDGTDDVLWRRTTDGVTLIWGIVDSARAKVSWPGGLALFWDIVGIGDFDNDGIDDILCQHNSDGRLLIWKMNNYSRDSVYLPQSFANTWTVVGVGDFNDDGTDDVLYRKDAGDLAIAEFSNMNRSAIKFPGGIGLPWSVKAVGDYNGDGTDDIFFQRDSDGVTLAWGTVNSVRVKIAWPGALASQWVMQ